MKKALQLREKLAQQDPDNAQAALDLGISFCKLGQVHRAATQYPEAEAWLRKALDQLRRLEAQGKLASGQERDPDDRGTGAERPAPLSSLGKRDGHTILWPGKFVSPLVN